MSDKFKLVPVEPTVGMLVAGNHGQPGDFSASKCWNDMLEAADRATRSGELRNPTLIPQGWKFGVSHGDGRVWLRISTPHGACATLSAADTSEGAGPTIAAQVLDYLRDTLTAAPDHPAESLDREAIRNAALEEAAALIQRESCECDYCKSHDDLWTFPEKIRALKSQTIDSQAEPSDTEMLDWLISHEGCVIESHSGFRVSYRRNYQSMGKVITQDWSSNAREAIKAAMRLKKGK